MFFKTFFLKKYIKNKVFKFSLRLHIYITFNSKCIKVKMKIIFASR